MGKECSWGAAMKRIYVVTEGQSETNFVKKVLTPFFLPLNKNLIPTTVLTKVDEQKGKVHKGGMVNYAKARNTILKDLTYTKKDDVFVTTMFDLYALPTDTPGKNEANKISDPYQKVSCIEKAMFDFEKLTRPVYHPYIQLHEFEALLFSDLTFLANQYFEYNIQPLINCLAVKKNPELINDGAATAPSKRILNCIPIYDKATDGVSVLGKIGINKLCQSCKHFSEWIEWMKSV